MVERSSSPRARTAIVFDGECAFCRRQIAWITRRDRAGAFEFVPRSTADLLQRFPMLASADLSTGMRAVLPDGRVAVGADAVYVVARRLRGWRWLALLYRVPVLHWLCRRAYGWIAANRYRLGPRCAEACAPAAPATREGASR